jgi:PIN domain nuclease of toxin-antitoxin system
MTHHPNAFATHGQCHQVPSPSAQEARGGGRTGGRGDLSWYELAWLARHERIVVNVPIRSWLQGLAAQLRTIGATPAIADTAASLPSTFPGDPADRLIYATAIEHGLELITKDRAIRDHDRPRSLTV